MSTIMLLEFQDCPVIAAVKNEQQLEKALVSDSTIIFFLYGDICSIARQVKQVKAVGKFAFVHLDLIAGLSAKRVAADFIRANTAADGVISTQPVLLKRAKELGLLTILRLFLLDSRALSNLEKQMSVVVPDLVELLPGLMPKVIRKVCAQVKMPVIAGGLISEKEDVIAALSAGAVSISTTKEELWMF